jgi:hypothetical protein
MGVATYLSPAGRINRVKGEILAHAVPVEVLGITGNNKSMPKKEGDTIIFRRWLPFGGATTSAATINQWVVTVSSHATQEGVTPAPDSLTPQDITVIMQQYSCLYMYTDRQDDLHEDDLPSEMKRQTGQRMGLVRELIRYGALRGCTNVFTRVALRARRSPRSSRTRCSRRSRVRCWATTASRSRRSSPRPRASTPRASRRRSSCSATPTSSMTCASFRASRKSRCTASARRCTRWKSAPSAASASSSPRNSRALRIPVRRSPARRSSPRPAPRPTFTPRSSWRKTPGAKWRCAAPRASTSRTSNRARRTRATRIGQRGYVGAKFYSAATVLNSGWMAILECAVTALS